MFTNIIDTSKNNKKIIIIIKLLIIISVEFPDSFFTRFEPVKLLSRNRATSCITHSGGGPTKMGGGNGSTTGPLLAIEDMHPSPPQFPLHINGFRM